MVNTALTTKEILEALGELQTQAEHVQETVENAEFNLQDAEGIISSAAEEIREATYSAEELQGRIEALQNDLRSTAISNEN